MSFLNTQAANVVATEVLALTSSGTRSIASLTSVKNDLVAIRAKITDNTDNDFDTGGAGNDLTAFEAKVTAFKAAVASLNTAVQAI